MADNVKTDNENFVMQEVDDIAIQKGIERFNSFYFPKSEAKNTSLSEDCLESKVDDVAIQKSIERFNNFYFPKSEATKEETLDDMEREYVDYLISTIDLDNEIIIKTYGKNLQGVIEDLKISFNSNSYDSSKSVLDSIVTIVQEYVDDCKLLGCYTQGIFKKKTTIDSIKKKYVKVSESLDSVAVELKREKRRVLDSISSLERYITKILEVEKTLALYVIAGTKVIQSNTERELNLDKNFIVFKSRIDDLKSQKFLLVAQLASLKITLESIYIVLKKIEYTMENVIPKWRLHMATVLQIQYVNDKLITNNGEFDELDLCLNEFNNIEKKDIDNDALITALINAEKIINH